MRGDRDGYVLGHSIAALSGALMGLLFGGAFETGIAAFAAVIVGGGLGWMARGLVR